MINAKKTVIDKSLCSDSAVAFVADDVTMLAVL